MLFGAIVLKDTMGFLVVSYHTNNHSITITLTRKFLARLCTHANLEMLEVDGLPPLSSFGLYVSETKVDVEALDELRRQERFDLKKLSNTYCITTVPKLYCLSNQEIKEIVNLISLHGYTASVEKFVHSYNKIQLGRFHVKVKSFRGGDNKDHVVFCKKIDGTNYPGIVENILVVSASLTTENKTCSRNDLAIVKIKPFKEHIHRYWFGQNSPMQLWSTQFARSHFILLPSVLRKCSFVKANEKFERLEIAIGNRSHVRTSEQVYFWT